MTITLKEGGVAEIGAGLSLTYSDVDNAGNVAGLNGTAATPKGQIPEQASITSLQHLTRQGDVTVHIAGKDKEGVRRLADDVQEALTSNQKTGLLSRSASISGYVNTESMRRIYPEGETAVVNIVDRQAGPTVLACVTHALSNPTYTGKAPIITAGAGDVIMESEADRLLKQGIDIRRPVSRPAPGQNQKPAETAPRS